MKQSMKNYNFWNITISIKIQHNLLWTEGLTFYPTHMCQLNVTNTSDISFKIRKLKVYFRNEGLWAHFGQNRKNKGVFKPYFYLNIIKHDITY